MVTAVPPTFLTARWGWGAAVVVALYLALLGGFVRATAVAPASTVIEVSARAASRLPRIPAPWRGLPLGGDRWGQ